MTKAEHERIRARVALKLKCNEIADKKWPASKAQARNYCRSDEAVGFSDALFAVAEGRIEVPALGIGVNGQKAVSVGPKRKRSHAKPGRKATPKPKKR